MDLAIYRRRKLVNRIGLTLSMGAMALGLVVLLWILIVLFKNGFSAIDWAMFTQSTPAPGSEGGGLANAIVGSLLMVVLTALVSTPIGIFAGVYLAEYGDQSKTASLTRFVTDIMLSAPSIVLGLFVIVGALHIDPANYKPFAPNGFTGIHQGAAIVQQAGVAVHVLDEARAPQRRRLPLAAVGAKVGAVVGQPLTHVVQQQVGVGPDALAGHLGAGQAREQRLAGGVAGAVAGGAGCGLGSGERL